MISCPTAAELQAALTLLDRDDGSPADPRRLFLARVADNARTLLEREATLGETVEADERARLSAMLGIEGDFADLNRKLCDALRSGAIKPRDPTLLAHLRASAIARIAIDQPGYCGLEALLNG